MNFYIYKRSFSQIVKSKHQKVLFRSVSMLPLLLVLSTRAGAAADFTWTGAIDTNFNNSNNYSPAPGPDVGDNILLQWTQGNMVNTPKLDGVITGTLSNINIGSGGMYGTLDITNGAQLTSNAGTIIGSDLGSTGVFNISGTGSAFIGGNGASTLYVGKAGTGTLNISDGGSLQRFTVIIADEAGSTGTVNIEGTTNLDGNYTIGNLGTGALNFKNQANNTTGMFTPALTMADKTGSSGSLIVQDQAMIKSSQIFTGSGAATIIVKDQSSLEISALGLVQNGAGTLDLSVLSGGTMKSTSGMKFAVDAGSTATVTVDGAGSVLSLSSNTNNIFGVKGEATVSVTNGGQITLDAYATLLMATDAGSTAKLTVDKSTVSILSTKTTMGNQIGQSGSAEIDIINGGVISNPGSKDLNLGTATGGTGTLKIDGKGSAWKWAGTNSNGNFINLGGSNGTTGGTGTLLIRNGASAEFNRTVVANGMGTTGTVTIQDTGSTLISGDLLVGADGGHAKTDILNGAQVTSGYGYIADDMYVVQDKTAGSKGDVLVSGIGSQWNVSYEADVGYFGKGTLNVIDGGVVSATKMNVSYGSWSTGDVVVSGVGSRVVLTASANISWLPGSLYVANAGTGTLTITDGGSVEAVKTYIANDAASVGTLNIGAASGSPAAASGLLTTASIAFGKGNGTLNFNYTDTSYILSAALSGSGTINQMTGITTLTGDGSAFTGMTNVKAGTLQIGDGGTTGSLNGSIINDTHVIFNRSDALEYTGSLGGAGDLRKLGAGMLTMSGDSSTFAGTTGVEGGSLFVSGTLGNANSGAVTVAAGSSLAGTGTIGGITTIANGAALIGNQGSVLTFRNSLILSGTSIVDASLGQAPNAAGLFNVQGNLTLNGVLNITDQGDFGPGLYRLFDYGGTLSGNGLTLGTVPHGADTSAMQFQNPANQYNLYVAGTVANNIWAGGDGIWNTTNTNWTDINGSQTGIWNQGDYAQFGTVGHQVTVDDSAGGLIVQGLVFSTDGYMLKGDYFTLEGSKNPTIRVGDGSAAGAGMTATIASELRGNQGLTKIDYGTLVLTGSNSYTGGTTVNQGILQLGDGGNSGSIAGDVVLNRDQYGHGTLAFDRVDTNTFAGKISGGGDVVQRGTGTTVFAGDNTFTGGLTVENGTAKAGIADHAFGSGLLTVGKTGTVDLDSFNEAVAGLAGSGHVALGSGWLTLDQDGDTSFSGTMDGTGSLTKNGSGKLTLSGTSTYSGQTQVNGGALIQAAAGSFSSASTYAVAQEGQIDLGGYTTGMASLSNAGTINFGGAGGTVLDVAGNYAGNSGTLVLNTVLGDDSSKTDFMKVGGDSSGTSIVKVINRGGIGAQTNEGIRLIEVVGQSNGMFNLAGDYTTKDGQQAVVAGAYAYTLHEGGVSTPADGDWYLRSELKNGKGPVINPGIPLYQGAVQSMQVLNKLPTLRQRVGNRFCSGATNPVIEQGADAIATPLVSSGKAGVVVDGRAVWGRIEGAHNRFEANRSTSGMKQDINSFILQTGVDGQFYEGEAGLLIGGITGQYGKAHSDIASKQSDGKIDTQSWGLGATLTWYGDNGFYADGQVQTNWYDNDYNSTTAKRNPANGHKGFGYALSAEAGQRIDLNDRWSLTPQVQLMWSSVDFDSFNDVWGTAVALRDGDSLTGRIGISADYRNVWRDANGQLVRSSIYGIANLYQELMGDMSIKVAEVNFGTGNDRTWGGIGAGGTYSWNDDTYALYGEGSLNTSLNNFADSYTIKGTAGFRIRW